MAPVFSKAEVKFEQIITRSSATAEKQRVSCPHIGGARPSSPHSLRLLSLHLSVLSNPKATTYTYVKRAVRKAHFKMNRAFKVILIGAGRSPEWSAVVMCN